MLDTLKAHVREPRRIRDRWIDTVDRLRAALGASSVRNDVELRRRLGEIILSTPPVACDREGSLEVHVVTCARDVLEALWALKTLYSFSGLRSPIVIHDDGTFSESDQTLLLDHFPDASVIGRQEADERVREFLRGLPGSERYRFVEFFPHALKLFDANLLSRAEQVLVLDSDVLFFRRPAAMLDCFAEGMGCFLGDYRDSYVLPRRRLAALVGHAVVPRVNGGLVCMPRRYFDLDVVERLLSSPEVTSNEHLPAVRFWREQTSYALLVSNRPADFRRLPATYEVGRYTVGRKTVCVHFVDDGSRPYLYAAGIRALAARGWPWVTRSAPGAEGRRTPATAGDRARAGSWG